MAICYSRPCEQSPASAAEGRVSNAAKASNAAITGWGKCLPPAVLTNDDLAQILDTTR